MTDETSNLEAQFEQWMEIFHQCPPKARQELIARLKARLNKNRPPEVRGAPPEGKQSLP